MKRIAILANPHGGWQRGIIMGLARHASAVGDWRVRVYTIQPGRAHRIMRWHPHAVVANLSTVEAVKVLKRARVPVVSIYPHRDEPYDALVTADMPAVGRCAVAYAVSRGFKRVTMIKESHHWWTERVADGAEDECRRSGIELEALTLGGRSPTAWAGGIERWLSGWQSPSFVCAESELAHELLEACRRRDVAVPEQVAVLSFEDHELDGELSHPQLSGVRFGGEEGGRVCGRVLEDLLEGDAPEPAVRLLEPLGVAERRSTDVTAIDDPLVALGMRIARERAAERINVVELAKDLRVGRRALEKHFRKAIGRSPLDEIRRVRLDLGRRWLESTDLPVTDVAVRCGYDDVQQFSRDFKRMSGVSPTRHRARATSTR